MILEKFEDLSPPALVLRVLKNFKSPSPLYKVWFLDHCLAAKFYFGCQKLLSLPLDIIILFLNLSLRGNE